MGPIQASLNQLTLSALGAVGGLAHGIKGTFNKPVAPGKAETPAPKTETTSGMGNIAKVGRNYANKGLRSYEAATKAIEAGNDAIVQKARSKYSPVATRLEQIKAASSLSVTDDKGGSK